MRYRIKEKQKWKICERQVQKVLSDWSLDELKKRINLMNNVGITVCLSNLLGQSEDWISLELPYSQRWGRQTAVMGKS